MCNYELHQNFVTTGTIESLYFLKNQVLVNADFRKKINKKIYLNCSSKIKRLFYRETIF